MAAIINPRAGKPVAAELLVDSPQLMTACFTLTPDPAIPA